MKISPGWRPKVWCRVCLRERCEGGGKKEKTWHHKEGLWPRSPAVADEGGWQGGQEVQGEHVCPIMVTYSFLKLKGIREGGVSNNTTFYVFTHGKDGAFEAFPIKDWFVSPDQLLLCWNQISGTTSPQFKDIRHSMLRRLRRDLPTGGRWRNF